MTSTTATVTDHLTDVTDGATVAPGRWPWAGVAGGLVAIASLTFLGPPFIDDPAVYEAGPEAVYAELSGQLLTQFGAAAGYLAAVLMVPFGIGLVRTLARRAPERIGLVLAAGVALAVGVATTFGGYVMKSVLAGGLPGHGDSAFYTEVDTAVVSTLSGQLQFGGWLPVVGAAGIVAVLSLAHRALPRVLGLFSAFIAVAVGAVTVAFNLPWSAGLVAPLWLIAVSVTVLRLRRREGLTATPLPTTDEAPERAVTA